jgi:hypothetical protein
MSRRRCSATGIFCCTFAVALGVAAPVRAAEAQAVTRGPHRAHAALGAVAAYTGIDDDGHWAESSAGVVAEAGYHYGALRWLELGAGAQYLELGNPSEWREMQQRALLPYLGVRFHTTGEPVEFGLSLRAGAYFLWVTDVPDDDGTGTRTHSWRGEHAAFRADVRTWISERIAIEVAPWLAVGGAEDTGSVRGFYMREQVALIALGVGAALVIAPF